MAIGALLLGACHADRAVMPFVGAAATPNVEVQGATNPKRGMVTIALVMRPHTAADVPFTGEGKLKDFVLNDDADPALPNSSTFTNVKPGAYEVEMDAAPPDGPLTDIRCVSTGGTDNNVVDVGSRRVTINVEASETVVCTFIDGWETGDMHTATQAAWGDDGTAGDVLNANFDSSYPTDLVIGGVHTLRFTSAAAVLAYLPAAGSASVLTSSLQDPVTSSSGELGGEALGLKLNADFSGAFGNAASLGDLRICNFTALPPLNGQTVTQVLGVANQILGGGIATLNPTSAAAMARFINNSFVSGAPSSFAQASLFDGACP